ncbi:MAG TPA: peroxidase, partial [Cyanophyceae cyanobacterium]
IGDALQSAISRFQHYPDFLNEEQEKVGLLFLCFQSNIFDQFMTLQKIWANQRDFVQYDAGVDAVIGQGGEDIQEQNWPKQWGKNDNVSFQFANFVRMKGGEFFFAPSISFLKTLES